MRPSTFERFLPLSGLFAALILAAAMLFTGSAPSVTGGSGELFDYYADHETAVVVSGFATGYFCLFMLAFAAGLRAALRSGEAGEASYSTVAFAGAVVVGLSIAAMGVIELASAEAAGKGETAVVTTLGYLDEFSWMPWTAGSAAMLLAVGIGGLRTLALPRWLAIVTLVLGVLCVAGPGGIVVYMVLPLWLGATAVVLHRRAVTPAPIPAPLSGAAAPTA